MADNTTVAVLGTGIMGAGMARNLLEAGMEVRVWNRTREKTEPLADDGARVAESPAEAAGGANFLVTMLAGADAVEEAVGGETLTALAEGAVWVQRSTVGGEGNERLQKIASKHRVAYVDAPALGTKQPPEQGALISLASGPEEVREHCQRVFDAVGSKTLWLGPAGAGSRAQACGKQLDRRPSRGAGRDSRICRGDRRGPRQIPRGHRGRTFRSALRSNKGADDD